MSALHWILAGVVVACIAAIGGVIWLAKKNSQPQPAKGMGDQPEWLRTGEEDRKPWGDQ